jgi:hypothetical protein
MKKKKNSDQSVLNQLSVNLYERRRPIIVGCLFIGVLFLLFLKAWVPISSAQAERQTVIDRLFAATNDTLLLTDDTQPLTQGERCIQGITDFYYGISRPFDDVVVDFDSLFVNEMHWRKYETRLGYDSDAKVAIIDLVELSTNEIRPEWEQYSSVYKVTVTYNHPSRQACLG